MKISARRGDGFWELSLSGGGRPEAGELTQVSTALAAGLDAGEPAPAFLVWNVRGAVPLDADSFATLLGASAVHRMRGLRVFVAGHGGITARYLTRLGMRVPGREALPGATLLAKLLARHFGGADGPARAAAALAGVLLPGEDRTDPAGIVELYRWRNEGKDDEGAGSGAAAAAAPEARSAAAKAPADAAKGESLGSILVELNVLTPEQLDEALKMQRHERARGKLGNLLIRMGMVSDEQIFAALEEQHNRSRQRLPASNADWQGQARETRETLLGNVLLSLGILSSDGLERALKEQWSSGGRDNLGAVLLRLGLVTRPQLFRALEKQAELKARSKRGAGALAATLPRT